MIIMIAAFVPVAIYTLHIVGYFIMPDELGYAKQAIQIGDTGWLVWPGDFYFNSWAQLLPVLMAIPFRLFDMPTAFTVVHLANAAVMSSTAIPVYLLAREFLDWRPAAYLAAALSVAVPWMAMSATMMTEVVAYPVFVWAVLAMQRAISAPSTRRDLLALAALAVAYFARTQLIFLAPALLVSMILHEATFAALSSRTTPVVRSLWLGLKRSVTSHPVLIVATGGVLATILMLEIKNSPAILLGNYVAPTHGGLIPPGTFQAAADYAAYIAVGIGVMPLILSAAWVSVTLFRPTNKSSHAFAVLLAVVVLMLALLVGSFSERFAAGINDRYYFYVAPLLFIGMVLCLLDNRRALVAIPIAWAGVALLVAVPELKQFGPSVVSPSFTFHQVLDGKAARIGGIFSIADLSPAALIASVTFVGSLVVVLVTRFWSGRRVLLLIGIPLLAYLVVETSYSLTKIAATQKGASRQWLDSRNWIDNAIPSDARVGVILAPLGDISDGVWWDTSFWNETVDRSFLLPGGDTFNQGFVRRISIDPENGRLSGFDEVSYLVKAKTDTRFQLRGTRNIAKNAGLNLIQASRPHIASWAAWGLDQAGHIPPGKTVRIRFYGDGTGRATAQRARITLAAPVEANSRYLYRIASRSQMKTVTAAPGKTVKETIRVRIPAEGFEEIQIASRPPDTAAEPGGLGTQLVRVSLNRVSGA